MGTLCEACGGDPEMDKEFGVATGILDMAISEMPIAVLDFETTGLHPGHDRAVEVSIVRIEPKDLKPKLVFDTLINPRRRVSATEIHGITDSMVRDAPEFKDIWPSLRDSLSGCVVAAYNAYFDMRFLTAEADRVDACPDVPFVCLMNIRTLIGVGQRCRLDLACRAHGVRLNQAHRSARDAMASACLLPDYMKAMRSQGIATFEDLYHAGSHKYLQSFLHAPILARAPRRSCDLCPREKAR